MDASTELHSTCKGLCCLDIASHLIPPIAVFSHQLVLAPFYRGGNSNTGGRELLKEGPGCQGAGEMTQPLTALTVQEEDPGSLPNTHTVTHNYPFPGVLMPSPGLCKHQA